MMPEPKEIFCPKCRGYKPQLYWKYCEVCMDKARWAHYKTFDPPKSDPRDTKPGETSLWL